MFLSLVLGTFDSNFPWSRDRKTNNATGQVATFALDSSWAVLIGHCETDHQDACEELEKLSPSQVVERLQRGKHLS